MRHFGDIEAIRLYLHSNVVPTEDLPAKAIRFEKWPDAWHTAIIRESILLLDHTKEVTQEAIELFDKEIESRKNSTGRMIEPAFPIQLSYGIGQMAKILDANDRKLTEFERNLEFYASKATFEADAYSGELARTLLRVSWETIERTRLTLQSYMWMQWITESLEQADQFRVLLENPNFLSEHTEDSFGYIAHPPLVVATLSCTAMIEEVGAEYINKLTEMEVNPNRTSCSNILKKLRKSGLDEVGINLDSIKAVVVDARNELSHYISSRGQVVTTEGFQEYYLAIFQGILLVRRLLNELLADTYKKESELLSSVSEINT